MRNSVNSQQYYYSTFFVEYGRMKPYNMNKEWKMMQGSYEMLLSDIAVLLAGNQFDTEAVSKSLKLICDSFSFT